ncbi:MAG TPA: hypothetical protein VGN61_16660, partial [Verrucomicrobiae bacterium]
FSLGYVFNLFIYFYIMEGKRKRMRNLVAYQRSKSARAIFKSGERCPVSASILSLVNIMRSDRHRPDSFALDIERCPQIACDIHGVDGAAIMRGQPANLMSPQAWIERVGFKNRKCLACRSRLYF